MRRVIRDRGLGVALILVGVGVGGDAGMGGVLEVWGRNDGAVMAATKETAVGKHVAIGEIGGRFVFDVRLGLPPGGVSAGGTGGNGFSWEGGIGSVVEWGFWAGVAVEVDLDGS